MSLEKERLELDKARFSHEQRIDELRLGLERTRLQSEVRFTNRYLASILTGVVSFAAVIVSLSQIVVANTSKQKELELARIQKHADWNLQAATFVVEHDNVIFGPDPDKRARISQVMQVTFPPEITKPLFGKIVNASQDASAKSEWAAVLEKVSLPSGYFQLQSRATDLYLSVDPDGKLIQSPLTNAETQIWTVIPIGDKGYCYLTTKNHREECLEIKHGLADDYIGLGKQKTENADDQQWAFREVQPGYYLIRSKLTLQAIDVPWGDSKIQRLGLFSPHGSNNQQWKLISISQSN